MRRILTLIFLFLCFATYSWAEVLPAPADSVTFSLKRSMHDKWFGEDKAHHFMVSAFLTGFSYYSFQQEFGLSQQDANVAAVSLSFSIGFAKEIYDGVSGKGNPSLQDLVADAAGVVLAVIILNVSSQ